MAGILVTPAVGGNDPLRRAQDTLVSDLGIIAQTGSPVLAGSTASTQVIYGAGLHLYAGEVITNIIVCVSTAGTSTAPTDIKLGLWDSGTPTCVAVTGSLGADARWTSTGFKVNALTGAYTVPSTGFYYPCFWQNGAFAGTALQLIICNNAGPTNNQIGSGKRPWCTLKTGAASMAVNDTGTYGGGVQDMWFAVS